MIATTVINDAYNFNEKHDHDHDTFINMTKNESMIAFGVESFYSKESKNNESLVTWLPQLIESDGNKNENRTNLGYRPCTASDYSKFYEPNASSKSKIDHLKEKKVLYCLDGLTAGGAPVNLSIWGQDETVAHRRLQVTFIPKHPVGITALNDKVECSKEMTADHE